MFGRNSAEVMCFRKFGHGGFFGAKKGGNWGWFKLIVPRSCQPGFSSSVGFRIISNKIISIGSSTRVSFLFRCSKHKKNGSETMMGPSIVSGWWLCQAISKLTPFGTSLSREPTNLHNFALQCAMREWQCIFPRQWRNLWVCGWWILKALATLKIS